MASKQFIKDQKDCDYVNDFNVEDDCLPLFVNSEDDCFSSLDSTDQSNDFSSSNLKRKSSINSLEESNEKRIKIDQNTFPKNESEQFSSIDESNSSGNSHYLSISFEKAEKLELKLLKKLEQIQMISNSTRSIINSFFPYYSLVQSPNTQIKLSDIAEMATLVEQIAKYNEISSNNSYLIIKNQQLELKELRDKIQTLTKENSELKSTIQNKEQNSEVDLSNEKKVVQELSFSGYKAFIRKNDNKENIYNNNNRPDLTTPTSSRSNALHSFINQDFIKQHSEHFSSPPNQPMSSNQARLVNINRDMSTSKQSALKSPKKPSGFFSRQRNKFGELENRCSNIYNSIFKRNLRQSEFIKMAKEREIFIPYEEYERLNLGRGSHYRLEFRKNSFIIFQN